MKHVKNEHKMYLLIAYHKKKDINKTYYRNMCVCA